MGDKGRDSGKPSVAFSTESIDPGLRFDYWREERGSKLFGVSMELDRRLRTSFDGRFAAQQIGGATLVEMSAQQAYEIERSERHIADAPGNALCIAKVVEGHGWQRTCGTEFICRAGTVTVGHSDVPYNNGAVVPGRFHLHALKIPLGPGRYLPNNGLDSLHFRPIDERDAAQSLLSNYFHAFMNNAAHLDEAVARVAVQTLTDLALVVRGALAREESSGRAALDAGLLQRIRDTVEMQLHRVDLTPVLVASLCAVSVRKLHQSFEPTGTTFSRYVLGRRLERAYRQLVDGPPCSVTEVAHGCGFTSLQTFYRAFRRVFGMTPGEIGPRARRRSAPSG